MVQEGGRFSGCLSGGNDKRSSSLLHDRLQHVPDVDVNEKGSPRRLESQFQSAGLEHPSSVSTSDREC